jgi:hypothetical protein
MPFFAYFCPMQQFKNAVLLKTSCWVQHRGHSLTKYNNNNSIKFFTIYVPSQQPKGQLQAEHSLDTGNYIIYKPKLQANTGGRKK